MSDQGSSLSLGPTGTVAEMTETAECPTKGQHHQDTHVHGAKL